MTKGWLDLLEMAGLLIITVIYIYLDNKSYDKQRQKLDEIYDKVLEEGYKVNKW